jgi:hypothetical protein
MQSGYKFDNVRLPDAPFRPAAFLGTPREYVNSGLIFRNQRSPDMNHTPAKQDLSGEDVGRKSRQDFL